MLAIFKKEFLSYFRSAKGYVFLAVNLLFSGLFITFCNFLYQSARIERSLEMMVFVLLFTVPAITMKSFAGEKAGGTDALLESLPLRRRDVILGKLLAALALIGSVVAVALVFPPILSAFGKVNFAASYAAIFGFALFAVAYAAICFFVSFASKKVLTAGLVSHGVAVAFFVLWLVLLNFSAALPSPVTALLGKLSLIDAFDGYALGIIGIYNIVFFASIAAFFILMTFRPKTVAALSLAAVLVALNVLSALAPKRLYLDLSTSKSYSISKSTVEFLSTLDEDVTLYVIDADGTNSSLEHQLALYDEHSKLLHVEYVALEEIVDELIPYGYTESSVISPYSFYVKSEHRAAFSDATGAYVYYHPDFGEMSYSTYNSYISMLYQYAASDASYQETFLSLINNSIVYYQLDAMLANYVEYVSVDVIPTFYYMTSHGTPDMTSVLGLTLNDMGVKTLDLASAGELPADLGSLIINAPATDLTDSERDMLGSYLKNGGAAVFVTNEENLAMPNLMSLLTVYGVSADAGLVATDEIVETEAPEGEELTIETVASYYVTASVNPDHDALYAIADESVPMMNANPINVPSTTDGSIIITPLLTTLDTYIDTQPESIGNITVAVAIEKETEGGTTEIAWFTGADSLTDDYITVTNFYALMYATMWGIENYETQVGNIPPTLMTEDMIAAPKSASTAVIALSLMIPAAIGVCGIVVCHKRKTRKPAAANEGEE